MALLEINRDPTPSQLRWFALFWFPAFWILIAAMIWSKSGAIVIPAILAGIAIALGLAAFFSAAFARQLWVGWMMAVFPIGFVMSHILVAIVFFLVFTPVGFAMRLLGHDPMKRRFDPAKKTYWETTEEDPRPDKFFRQF